MPLQHQPISRAGQAALATWVNTFPLDRKVERLEDLADGNVFAQMLHDLDPEYDPSELEQNTGSSAWLNQKRNVQAVFKALTKYIIHKDRSGTIDFLPRTVDVRSISDNLNAEGIAQLVAIFTTAAMLGEQNTKYIPIMRTSLSTAEQAEIMTILQRKDEERQRLAENGAMDPSSLDDVAGALDPGLVAEAQLATLASDYDRLSKRLADSNTRLEHLQISYEVIKEDLERKEKELDLERQKHGASESQLIRDLHEKIREQDDLISNQEGQLEDDRIAKQRLTQENAQLARKAALVEQLQDQVQELKHANDDLSKKANTVDRYKQKLEAQRGIETDLQNAMYELGQNKESLKEFDVLQKRCAQQQITIERFREMVSGLEQQIEDNRIQKTVLDGDIYAAHVQLETLKEQNQNNETRIFEFEQQLLQGISGGGGGGTPGSPSSKATPFNLEDELQHTDDPAAAYTLEINRLRAENTLLRGNVNVGSENDRLRAELDVAKTKEEQSRKNYNDIFEKYALAESHLKALEGGGTHAEGGAALFEAQRKLQETSSELERNRAAARELENQVADKTRETLRLRADLGAVDKGSVDALEELKSADMLISESLKKELESLRKDFRGLQVDQEQQQKQLIEALISKEELRKTMGTPGAAAPSPSPADGGGGGGDSELRKANDKNEKLRAAMKTLKKHLDAVEQERADLHRRLKADAANSGSSLSAGGSAGALTAQQHAAQLAAKDQVIKNLQREIAMVTTAWYDITSRLQSNHVVLQRRPDMPKSWLNKQRQMVNERPGHDAAGTAAARPIGRTAGAAPAETADTRVVVAPVGARAGRHDQGARGARDAGSRQHNVSAGACLAEPVPRAGSRPGACGRRALLP
ncbi:microtubule binding protein [Ophiostoma piceae UAMH 11346]|uniref:Microtubule binding protein n=1 Tax=Ophiostoma piceae (strain UAMH 11346) TaxID=1262450 RepID=S3CBF9_OPHP1|nr:microtubule binding protein [Ophiostoma piceae UAMH 11346]